MFHKINSDCFACGACLRECPVGAIVPAPKNYRIEDRVCIDCAACVPVCPVDAIVPTVAPEKLTEAWARSVMSEAAE